MAALGGVQTCVVAVCFDVGDVLDGHEAGDAAEFDGYVVRVGLVDGYPRCGVLELGGPPDASASRSRRTGLRT